MVGKPIPINEIEELKGQKVIDVYRRAKWRFSFLKNVAFGYVSWNVWTIKII